MTIAIKALIAVAMFLAGAAIGYDYAHQSGKAAMEEHLAADRKEELAASLQARAHEYQLVIASNEAEKSYEQGKKDAEAKYQTTLAAQLDGSLKLQNRWAGCEADRLSDAAATTSKLNAAARDRAQSASRIISVAAACDAKDRAWQQWATQTTAILTSKPK